MLKKQQNQPSDKITFCKTEIVEKEAGKNEWPSTLGLWSREKTLIQEKNKRGEWALKVADTNQSSAIPSTFHFVFLDLSLYSFISLFVSF